jgi:membrane-bound lytic murein transglycosylase D
LRLLLPFLAILPPVFPQAHSLKAPLLRNLTAAEMAGAGEKGFDAADPPRIEPLASYLNEPTLLIPKPPAGASLPPPQRAIQEAERHFQYGKFFLQEGDRLAARREFDLATDLLLAVPAGGPDRALVERRLMEMSRHIHRYDLEQLGAGERDDAPVFPRSPLEEILNLNLPGGASLKDKALASIQSGTSQLPLAVNDAVLGYINYFTSPRGQRILLSGLRRSGRYREMISAILAEEGLPQELIFLAQAESGFMPRAKSVKSAAGMWQFMRGTGLGYGLSSSRLHDDRFDPEKATRAAAQHLRDLYRQTGDWYLALAAYNCGPYCVERAVQRTGYADFWELRRRSALPKETMNYVPAILAMAIVSRDMASYGIAPAQPDLPLEYDTIRLPADTNLALIADAADVPAAEIKELNPWLLRGLAPAGSELKVPAGRAGAVLAALAVVPEAKRASWRLHRISSGETLAGIAKRYSTAQSSIMAANSQWDAAFFRSPEPGEFLLIPAVFREVAAKRPVPAKTGGKAVRAGKAGSRSYPARASARRTAQPIAR